MGAAPTGNGEAGAPKESVDEKPPQVGGHRLSSKVGTSARTVPCNLLFPKSFATKNAFNELQDSYASQQEPPTSH